jgi:uncharacterized RDD family membrane protein YckC
MTAQDSHALAPLGRRASAWLIDAALGGLLAVTFVKAAGGERDLRSLWQLVTFKSLNGQVGRQLSAAMSPASARLSTLKPIAGLLVIIVVIFAVCTAYRIVTTATWGAGFGKTLLGLQVIVDHPEATGASVPGWARSWKRWAVPQVSSLIPLPATGLLAYLPALRDSRRRGLHDRAAGTIVIDRRRPILP